jgi:hypothetical protein
MSTVGCESADGCGVGRRDRRRSSGNGPQDCSEGTDGGMYGEMGTKAAGSGGGVMGVRHAGGGGDGTSSCVCSWLGMVSARG